MSRIPVVDYLVLEPRPHLRAHECINCGAKYFDRRNACAACGGDAFGSADVPSSGILKSFTIVHHAAPGIATPFVAGVVDCGGTSVRANIINTAPDPEHVSLGMPVRLATYSLGTKSGVEAIGYGFEPEPAQ
ncbi:Zn-ribbon domain-containing OB-fold protein [Mycobacterium sp. E1747]|uniref:Zn-ribbon domain-containing OB-fold protein n=1 Tax=Mycobacterium sp. E1747 TaxID=1834128 RepID=UPI0007FCFF6A|nr:OB-fold domain-containing protein [Mycobacterium sp. E1747]OBH05901.1 hypothetical protein A5695_06610 [Mycobacterium sp. E1747]